MTATDNQYNLIESLLNCAALPFEELEALCIEVNEGIGEITARGVIMYLKANQRDSIRGGFNYSQSDISDKLKEF